MPPYYVTVPQGNQRISASQPQIQANFGEIQTLIGVDHVTFTGGANIGKHNVVQFMTTAPATIPAPAATEIDLFNKIPLAGTFGSTGFQELFIKLNNGAGHALEVPITAKSPFLAPNPGAVTLNWFYLPCGWLVKYGLSVADGAGLCTVALNAQPTYNAHPYVYCLAGGADVFPDTFINSYVSNVTNGNFLVTTAPNAVLSWVTIGSVVTAP